MVRVLKKLVFISLTLLAFNRSSAQIFQHSNNYGVDQPRGSFDSALYFPTACGVPTDTMWLFSQGFGGKGEKLRHFAIYGDSCGHVVYLWDPSAQSWSAIGSGAGADSTGSHAFYTKYRSDTSRINIYNAIAGKVTNSGGAKFLGSGVYSSKPLASAGPGMYYSTGPDSIGLFYSDGSAWTRATDQANQAFNIYTSLPLYVKHGTVDSLAAKNDSAAWNAKALQGFPISSTTPTTGQVPQWNGTNYVPTTPSGGTSFANPSASVGLAAVNGSASTAMRSDAAPALSQAIVPTWSAQHTFNILPILPVVNAGFIYMGDSSANGVVPAFRKLVVKDLPKFSNFPSEKPWGLIYDQTFWINDAGLSLAPISTGAGSNTSTIVLSNGVPTISSTGASWGNVVLFNGDRPTLLSPIADTVWCTYTSPVSANSTGGALVFQSLTPGNLTSYKFYINTSTSANGTITGGTDVGSSLGSPVSGTAIAQNDHLQMAMTRTNDSTLVFSYRNLTSASAWFSFTVNFGLATSSSYFPMNTGAFGFITFSQTPGATSFSIQRVKVTSNAIKYASQVFAGTSKFAGIGGVYFHNRLVTTLGATFPTCVNYGDGGGTLAELLKRRDEILATNPQVFVLEHCNDTRFGYTVAQTEAMINIVAGWFKGRQTQFYITVIPEDSVGAGVGGAPGLTALKNYDSITFGSHYIDNWNRFTNGGNIALSPWISADHIHPTQATYTSIDSMFRARGILITADPARLSPYNTYAPDLTPVGDSLANVYKTVRIKNRLLQTDDSLNIVPSMIKADAQNITIAPNQSIVPTTTSLLHVWGRIEPDGPIGGFILPDQVAANTQKFFIANSNKQLSYSYDGVPIWYMSGTTGQFLLTTGSNTQNSVFQITGNRTFNAGQNLTGWLFNIDQATLSASIGSSGLTEANIANIDKLSIDNSAGSYSRANTLRLVAPAASGGIVIPSLFALKTVGNTVDSGTKFIIVPPATGTSSDSVLVWTSGTGEQKKVDQSSIRGSSPPFADNSPLVKNNSDNTKQWKFNAAKITTGNTRILTMRDTNTVVAGVDVENNFGQPVTVNAFGLRQQNSGNSNETISVFNGIFNLFGSITADRTVTITPPSFSTSATALYYINVNTAVGSAFHWSPTNTITDLSGNSISTFDDATSYLISYDGSYKVISKTPSNDNGSYSPTIGNTTNVASSTVGTCYWTRRGNQVHVWGRVSVTATLTATGTSFTISLPIASAFTTADDASGQYSNNSAAMLAGGITADAVNDKVTISYTSINTASEYLPFNFDYVIK